MFRQAALVCQVLLLLAGYVARAGDSLPRVHDPVMIKEGAYFYVFSTGMGISVMRSADLHQWENLPPVFSEAPKWALEAVAGFKGHIWAPDIAFVRGRYYLYYSVSAFGKNTSCIGVASNRTLDPSSPDYRWQDHGKVMESVPGRDQWNAIDPNFIIDENGRPWLSFGSFWNGIQLVALDSSLTKPAHTAAWYTLATRPRDPSLPDTLAGDGAIEAPFIVRRNGFYYLFVSFDYCCRAEKSTYKIMVGRSRQVSGPYVDKTGRLMTRGGGSLVKQGDNRWAGTGHNAVCTIGGEDYLIYHAYDLQDRGRPKLQIKKITWKNDWPELP